MLRVGIDGLGRHGRLLLRFLRSAQADLGCVVVGAVTRSEHRFRELGREFGIPIFGTVEKLLEATALDILVVATPDHVHHRSILAALDRGVNVFAEKPMTTSVDSAQEIVKTADRKGLFVGVDFHKRFDPASILLREQFRSGKAGDLLYVSGSIENRVDIPTEWLRWSSETSPIWFLGCHYIDLCRFVTGTSVTEVFAVGRRGLLARRGIETLDAAFLSLRLAGGAQFQLCCSWVLPLGFESPVRQGFSIVCSRMAIFVDAQDRGIRLFSQRAGCTPNPYFVSGVEELSMLQGYCFEPVRTFVLQVRRGVKHPWVADAVDGLEVVRVAEAAHKSIEVGKPVSLRT